MKYKKQLLWGGAALLGLFLIYWFLIRSTEPTTKMETPNATNPSTTTTSNNTTTSTNTPMVEPIKPSDFIVNSLQNPLMLNTPLPPKSLG